MRENTKNKYEKDKSLFESCKDLQNDEVVVTNFDYYRNQIYEIGINDYHEQMFSEAKDINSKIIDSCK